jgi:iron complex transport system ATP-binding protein
VRLQLENLKFAYNSARPVLRDISLEASPGEITALIGPNASGKSTLLKCIASILKPEGNVLLGGKKASEFKKKDITRYISYLPQDSSSRALVTVFEAVLLGRLQFLSWHVSEDDLAIAMKSLQDIGIANLASRFLDELSGGQKQMVSIAQALVREPRVLLLDEPTSNLDLQHTLEILDLIRDITSERGITTIIALHDLGLSARYADMLVVLRNGEIYASGEPKNVLTQEMIRTVYRVNARVSTDEGSLQVTPISSIRNKSNSISPG